MNENKTWLEEQNYQLAKKAIYAIAENMNGEIFLNLFKDKYNWFAFMGISEEEYQTMSYEINTKRKQLEEEYNKQEGKGKILIK